MTAKKIGRPCRLTARLATRICMRLIDGESLRQICDDEKMPGRTTVKRWLAKGSSEKADPMYRDFRTQYAHAREIQAEMLVDEILEIADDSRNDWMERHGYRMPDPEAIQRSKVRIEARKWLAAKLLPKLYGDRLSVGGDSDHPIQHEHRWTREQVDAAFRVAKRRGFAHLIKVTPEEVEEGVKLTTMET